MRFISLTVGIAFACVGVAHAQDAEIVEAPGVQVGESYILHPTVGAETGVVSNLFYEDGSEVPITTTGVLRLIGQLDLGSRGNDDAKVAEEASLDDEAAPAPEPTAPKLAFRAGLRLQYEEFLSGDEFARAQRNLGFAGNAHLVAFPEGTLAFLFDDDVTRNTRPTNFESLNSNNRIVNHLNLGLKFQPGGRAISGAFRYENVIDFFEDSDLRYANRMQQTLGLRGEWQWLPITRFLADVSYGFYGALGSDGTKESSNPLRAQLGIASAITEMTTLKAHVGWGYSPYSVGESYNTPLFGAEFGYRYHPFGRFTLMYTYDARDSVGANFYRDHVTEVRIAHQIRQVVLDGNLGLRFRGYRSIEPELGAPERDDVVLDAGARARWLYRDWMAFVAEYQVISDQTDYMPAGQALRAAFTRHDFTLGVRAAF